LIKGAVIIGNVIRKMSGGQPLQQADEKPQGTKENHEESCSKTFAST
jgi:hypothetical protein